ncbi:MAG TPA: FHA domain-containing protein [Thermoanaerobaculia bacterium]|nr:FHA domain-containing protein [Thermoanaerobaculia bacterium]
MRKRFGKCVFDSETRQLWREAKIATLSPKGLALLELLLERAPKAVSKDEIQASLWPETFVSEANLTTLISDIRTAIGDPARQPRFVRTVHRFGYAFSGDVVDDSSDATVSRAGEPLYRLILGNRKLALGEGENVLGRHPDNRVQIDQTAVSRRHARISIRAGKAVLEDLKSRNGTFLRGRRLGSPADLRDGDVIGLGPITMTFRIFSSPDSTEKVTED